MILETLRFGALDTDGFRSIHFPDGMPGLENHKDFFLLDIEEYRPLYWLQSLTEGSIALPLVDPFQFFPDFSIDINDDELRSLDLNSQDDLFVLSVAVIPEDIEDITINLVSPVFMNIDKGIGRQIVIDKNANLYSVREPLFGRDAEKGE